MAKERLTALFCCSMTGEKLPPFVIGKSEIPGAFRSRLGINKKTKCFLKPPPVKWFANKKAWINADLFEKWLDMINSEFVINSTFCLSESPKLIAKFKDHRSIIL